MRSEDRVLPPSAMRWWVAANFVAFMFGAGLAGGVLRYLGQPYYGTVARAIDAARIQMMIVGLGAAVFGLSMGIGQWTVLRRALRVGWWPAATVVGWVIVGVTLGAVSGLVGGSISDIGPESGPLSPAIGAIACTVVLLAALGTFQWLVIRPQVVDARTWPLASPLALVAGLSLGFLVVRFGLVEVVPFLKPTDFPSPQALVLVGAVTGLVYGLVTWPVVAAFRRQEASDQR